MAGEPGFWEAILLGVVQGLTEWLPVSSSGHLVLAQALFGVEAPVFFELVVHVGTLLVVLVFYRREIAHIVVSWLRWPGAARRAGSWALAAREEPHRWLGVLVVVGTLPTVVVGLLLRDVIAALFSSLLAVGLALVWTGLLLALTGRCAPRAPRPGPLRLRDALLVGAMQGLAILPGVSRSGSTIGTALLLGWDREVAARFSFLLFIPAVIGATVLQATPEALASANASLGAYAAAFGSAVVVGYVTLAWLVRLVARGGLHRFAPYCLVVGGGTVLWALVHL